MIPESLTTHVLQGMLLAMTPSDRWNAARSPIDQTFTIDQLWITLAVMAQIGSLIIICWLIAKKKRLDHDRKQQITRLEIANEGLLQEITELKQQVQAQASEQDLSAEKEESDTFPKTVMFQ